MPNPRPLLAPRGVTRRAAATLTGLAVVLLAACGGTGGTGTTAPSDKSTSGAAPSATSFNLIAPGVITAATQPEQVPFNYAGPDGKPIGFSIDLGNEAAKRLGLKVEYKITNLQELLAGVTAGKYDVGFAGVGVTEERMKSVDFVRPYYWSYVALLTPSESTATSPTDFKGKRVGVVKGSVQETLAKKIMTSSQLVSFKDQPSALGKLLSDGIDAFMVGGPSSEEYVKKYKGKLKAIYAGDSLQGTGFPVHKGNTALVTALDDAIDEMIDDGTYKKLYDKYFTRSVSPLLVAERPSLAKYAEARTDPSTPGAAPSQTP